MNKECKACSLAETAKLLQAAKKLVLCSHISPDGDTFGSTLGLGWALEALGKQVIYTVDDEMPNVYKFMPGIEKYHRFTEGEEVAADLLVVIDASSADRAGNAMTAVKAPVLLNIDHHKTNTLFADYLYLDAKAAATAEIMYKLIKELGVTLSYDMALCLFTGLYTDTGSFKYSNTTPCTLQTAADLLRLGVDPSYISDNMEVKSRTTVEMLGTVLKTMDFLAQGRIAYVEIAPELYNKDVESDTFISYPRYIEGVEVALLFKQVAANLTRVSMRSKTVDVSKIALGFGGGGHAKAAGCSIASPLAEAKATVLPVIEAALNEAPLPRTEKP